MVLQIFQKIEGTSNFLEQLDTRIMPGTKHVPRWVAHGFRVWGSCLEAGVGGKSAGCGGAALTTGSSACIQNRGNRGAQGDPKSAMHAPLQATDAGAQGTY